MNPRVYLETSIISYLAGWLNRHDLYVAAQQEFTRDWWANRRKEYDLFASAVVVKEAQGGTPELAAARLAFLDKVGGAWPRLPSQLELQAHCKCGYTPEGVRDLPKCWI